MKCTRRRSRIAAGILAVLVAAAVLVPSAGAARASASARAPKRIDVVAAFYPLAFAASAVGGEYVAVSNLTPAGVEPHDLELTTDQVNALQDARLVLVMGKGFQPAMEKIARDRDGESLAVLDRLPRLRSAGGGADGALDPHVWLDPTLMRAVVDEVRAALIRADPGHATAFATNAARVRSRLDALDAEYRAGLASCPRRLVVTAHEAFGYLAREYGLRQEGVAGLAPDAEPSANRLAKLSDLAKRKGVTTIFTEELVSPKVAQTIAREAGGLQTAMLNPLEGLTQREIDRGDDYFRVMRANLDKIARALGCRSG